MSRYLQRGRHQYHPAQAHSVLNESHRYSLIAAESDMETGVCVSVVAGPVHPGLPASVQNISCSRVSGIAGAQLTSLERVLTGVHSDSNSSRWRRLEGRDTRGSGFT